MFKYKKSDFNLDIVFPNKTYGGVYALAPLIIYNLVNNRDNWYCKRVFLDHGKITAPIVGFTLQYELDLKTVLDIKPKNKITFAGGPLTYMNPKSISKHFDFLILGDVEEILPKVLDEYEKDKEGFLNNILKIKGVYIHNKSQYFFKEIKDLNKAPYPLVQPYPEIDEKYIFGKAFILEIERGCPFKCKFCPLPNFYNKYQFRSLNQIKKIIDEGIGINNPEKIIIYSPSFVHPQRKDILKYLIKKKIRVTIPSLRAETLDKETLELIKRAGQESLTIAPEAGESLRYKINKEVKDEAFYKFIDYCNELKFRKLKLYMLLGLPGATDKDLQEWITFVKECQKRFNGKLTLSVNYFVPKKTTPFAEHKFDKKELKRQVKIIKKELKFSFKLPSLSSSYKEWLISQDLD